METKADSNLNATLSVGAAVLLFAYTALAVLKQSDVELVLPSSSFDLGGLLDRFKEGIPAGTFVAPLLQLKIPLYLFYAVGPVALVALHAVIIVFRPDLLLVSSAPLRLGAVWLPPLTIAVMIWRFAICNAARPQPPSLGTLGEALQQLALAADLTIVIFFISHAAGEPASEMPGENDRATAVLARAGRHGGVVWLIMLLCGTVRSPIADVSGSLLVGKPAATALLALFGAALFFVWLYEGSLIGRQTQAVEKRPWYQATLVMEDLNMQGRLLTAGLFLVLTSLPAMSRGLDLSGESLVARAPTEAIISALIIAKNADNASDLAVVREIAWTEYGRGIDLDAWRFEGTKFDRATMVGIRLRRATLRDASLDYAVLIGADLKQAKMERASLRYSDLRGAQGQGANLQNASLRGADMRKAHFDNFINTQTAQVATGSKSAQGAAEVKAEDPCKDVKREDRTDFSNADLSGADLSGADFSCSILRGVTMDSNTKLTKTKLDGANLCGANLRSADFSDAAGAATAIFSHSDLSKAKLPQDTPLAHIEGAIIGGTTSGAKPNMKGTKYINAVQREVLDAEKRPETEKRRALCNVEGDPGYIPK